LNAACPVIIFSTDRFRGKITQEVLKRTGLESLLVKRVLEAREAMTDNAPRVAILDTTGIFPNEIDLLRNFCRTLRDTTVIVLGDRSIVDAFAEDAVQERLCLPDPLDPELIAAKVKEIFSSKRTEEHPGGGSLEGNLKQFLKLD
jgi:DNA-binding NtrC family response regulator